MATRRPGAAIEWLLRPWVDGARRAVRAGRIATVALALIALILPSMMLYYGVDGWWWDASIIVCTTSALSLIAFDALADVVARVLARPMAGVARIGLLAVGLVVGISAGYAALLAFTLSPERAADTVIRDYRRSMSIVVPVVTVLVIAGSSLWYRAEASRMQTAAANARYAVLEGQMQPHMLFNALNALKELTLDDPERASRFAQRLADLYRLILEVSTATTSALAHEVKIVDAYLEVEQVRYGARLRYAIDVPEDLLAWPVPSLVLQTLAENAVRHGIAKARAGGEVVLRATRTSVGALQIELSNTGAPFAPETAERGGVGLENTRARLRLMYGDAAELTIATDDTRATVVRLVLPEATA